MANSYHHIYIHAVFAVKYRLALIAPEWHEKLCSIVGQLINETGSKSIIVNGVEDHLHCLFSLKPVISISELMRIAKGKSSKWINDNQVTIERFAWQEGYGAFSYSECEVENVRHYIANQREHHQRQSFRDEYLGLLDEFEIEYDEQYVFTEPV